MELKLETDFMLKHDLSPNELTILYLVHSKKNNILVKMASKMYVDPFKQEIERLVNIGYLTLDDYRLTTLTEEGRDLIEVKNVFRELQNAFPKEVIRKDGKTSYLRTDRKRSEARYLRLTRNRRDIHEYILKCLEFEIKQRTSENSMMWFKTMPSWLSSREWENWEDRMKEENIKKILDIDSEEYGTELE